MDLKIWFLIAAGLISLGVPLVIIGTDLPSAMNEAILLEAAEYAILDEDDYDFWALLPGRIEMTDIKAYYVYNCTNPEEVALKGKQPQFTEVGPFNYIYKHNLTNRTYTSEDNEENSRVHYNKEFKHHYLGDPNDLLKDYRVVNLAGMKRWDSVKKKERFQIAIEGFFETFTYSKVNLIRDMVVRYILNYFDVRKIYDLVKGLDNVSDKVKQYLASDFYYGLLQKENVYEWTLMCDTKYSYIEHEIMTYFSFSLYNFNQVKQRFCKTYIDAYNEIHNEICKNIPHCSDYNISYHQWMYANIVPSYANLTFKQLYGIYEFSNYTKQFFNMLRPEYVEQFKKVDWNKGDYHHLLATHHDNPNAKTSDDSLLLYENMKELYIAGKATQNPFKDRSAKGELDLSRFEEIARNLKVSKEQAFMLYCYFEYYVNNTVVLQEYDGDLVKERVGNYGAAVLRDISEYYRDFLDVLIYTRSLIARTKKKKCEDIVETYFDMYETIGIMSELKKAICYNTKFNTNVSTAVGWKYFVEASSYPYSYHYKRLEQYLKESIKEFTSDIFEAMIYDDSSPFYEQLNKIKKDVKKHYTTITGNKACENEISPYCTKRQLFLTQFYQSDITKHPFPDSNLSATSYISDWWQLIKPYIENDVTNELPGYTQLPDKPIEVPIEIPYLKLYYKNPGFTKRDLFKCFTFIKLYDTDTLYYLLLKINSTEELVSCSMFASEFFYNSLRYLIRNVQFGPMFSRIKPTDVFFGYYDYSLAIEHERLDYLEGDDCTINPYIGYNAKDSQVTEPTLDYLTLKHKMHTGMKSNNNLRKFSRYHGSSSFFYKRLVRSGNGDECYFINDTAFIVSIPANTATDGLQFPQHDGRTNANDTKMLFDSNLFRPIKIVRKTNREYNFYGLEVDVYGVEFASNHLCPDGIFISNGIDMTSFFQYKGIASQAKLDGINENNLDISKVNYTHPLENEDPPLGYKNTDSYYVIEPYTGITMKYVKNFMFSLVVYYDDLYQPPIEGNSGVIIPFYSMYEKANASMEFTNSMMSTITSTQTTRYAISIAFSVIGILASFSGVAMIIRACCLEPAEVPELRNKYLPDSDPEGDRIKWPDVLQEENKRI